MTEMTSNGLTKSFQTPYRSASLRFPSFRVRRGVILAPHHGEGGWDRQPGAG